MVLCAGVAAGHAEPVAAQESDESNRLLQEALTEYNAGRWDEAYTLFERMHRAGPSARTLRGMGLSAYEARRYATAVRDLGAALAETRRPLNAEQRKEVEKVLAAANGFVARFTLRLQPQDAQLAVDGREPLLEGESVLLLDPGAHELTASAQGYQSATRQLDVRAGDRRELGLVLQAQGSDATAAATVATTPDASAERDSGGGAPIVAYVAAGAAVLFVGGAVALHFTAKGAADDVDSKCRGACTTAQADAAIDDSGLELAQTLSFVSWGLAGASAAGAALLFVLAADDAPAERGVALGAAPGGISLSGRF